VDQLTVEVEGIDNKTKVQVVRSDKVEVEDIDIKLKVEVVQLGKVKVEDIDNKLKRSIGKRSTDECVATD
jgi:hypothetical protein